MARNLTAREAARVRALVAEGRSHREVARIFGVSHTTIGRVITRFLETGGDRRRPGSGRRRVTSERDDRFIQLNTLRRRSATSTEVQGLLATVRNVRVSSRTIRRRLWESNLRSRRPATGPLLTREHRVARLRFAREHIAWTLDDWRRVLFTDETRISVSSPDGRQQVWRRRNERYSQVCISTRVPFGGGSLMFWAGVNYEARTELVAVRRPALNAQRYVQTILEENVVPFAPFIGPDFILMHDNARPHSAAAVTDYLHEVGIEALDWPARSPDLNPIEHVWDDLKKRIRARRHPPENIAELEIAAQEEWQNIPQENIQQLISGMQRRLMAVIRARGGNTRY